MDMEEIKSLKQEMESLKQGNNLKDGVNDERFQNLYTLIEYFEVYIRQHDSEVRSQKRRMDNIEDRIQNKQLREGEQKLDFF